MGYYYHFHECNLFIENARLPQSEQLMHEYNEAIMRNGYASEIEDADQTALKQVAENNRWHVVFEEEGARIDKPYDSIKGSDNTSWLQALAPVIRDHSYVQVSDDDGRMWRYMFQGGKCFHVEPKWEISPNQKPYGEE